MTIAYDASSGTELWRKVFDGPSSGADEAASIAPDPDGTRVFVTGYSDRSTSGFDYETIAYDASTGTQVWAKRYNDANNGSDFANSVAASPDGAEIFVTGSGDGSAGDLDYATVAYDTATGKKLWATPYDGPGNDTDTATWVAVAPDGTKVFVTGNSVGSTSSFDYATIAYDASTGTKLWTRRYDGPGSGYDSGSSVAASPDGTKIFVSGGSEDSVTQEDFATIAYNASTGAELWTKRYDGPGNSTDSASSVAVSPDSTEVFVTGLSTGVTNSYDYATVAYEVSTGTKLWAKRYDGPSNGEDMAISVAAGPGGTEVFVTGESGGYATIAYDAAMGTELWTKRYSGPGNGGQANWVSVSPDGTEVFVTGGSSGTTTQSDFATIAYAA